jgi:hypothetical protein
MSLPRTVAEVLRQHVTLEVEGIDRMYLNVYMADLQREQGVVWFLRHQRTMRPGWMQRRARTAAVGEKLISPYPLPSGIETRCCLSPPRTKRFSRGLRSQRSYRWGKSSPSW